MKLLDILKEEITARELKDALRGKPYDIQVLSRFLMDKVKNFDMNKYNKSLLKLIKRELN